MRRWIVGGITGLFWLWSSTAMADTLPLAAWEACLEKSVRLELADGLEVTGTLLGVDDSQAVISDSNGEIVAVPRSQIASLHLHKPTAAPAAAPPRTVTPPAPRPASPLGSAPASIGTTSTARRIGVPMVVTRQSLLNEAMFSDALEKSPYDDATRMEIRRLRQVYVARHVTEKVIGYSALLTMVFPGIAVSIAGFTAMEKDPYTGKIPLPSTRLGLGVGGLGMIVTGMALVLPNYGVPQARLEVYEAISQANGRFSKVAPTPLPFLSVDEDGVMLGMNMRW